MILTLASACQTPSTPIAQAVPRLGGSIVVGSWEPPESLLAAGISDQFPAAMAVVAPMAEGLLRVRDQSEFSPRGPASVYAPQLATEVPTLENGGVKLEQGGMTVTWKLRPGVLWHDGTEFTSRDVVDTFQFRWLKYRDRNPTLLQSTAGWDQVSSVDAPDARTAVIHFKQPYGPYLGLGSGPYGILPGHLLEKTWEAGGNLARVKLPIALSGGFSGNATWDQFIVGTGPYLLKEFVADDHLTMVRNPSWWGAPTHQPYLDSIQFRFEKSREAELADLAAGRIDLALDIGQGDPEAVKDALGRSHGSAVVGRMTGVEHLDFNLKNRYLSNPVIRKAIRLALNRARLGPPAVAGKRPPPADGWICGGLAAWCEEPSSRAAPYDPKAASALLDQAGFGIQTSGDDAGYRSFGDGSTITLSLAASDADPVRLAEEDEVTADLKRIGIKVRQPYANVPSRRLYADFRAGGILLTHAFDLVIYSDSVNGGEPDGFAADFVCEQVPSDASPAAGLNATQLCDPAVDAAFKAGRVDVAAGDRRRDYASAQKALAADLPNLALHQLVVVHIASTRLRGVGSNGEIWTSNAANWSLTG